MESRRCLISFSMIASTCASSTVIRSSTSFCLMAASSRRSVPRRPDSRARMAAFMSSVMRSLRLMASSVGGIRVAPPCKQQRPAGGGPLPAIAPRRRIGVSTVRSVLLLGQHLAAQTLVVALHRGRLLALALGGRLLVVLSGAQLGQEPGFLDRALETPKRDVERLVFLEADRWHR